MKKRLSPKEVARRRIIEDFAIDGGKGKITVYGRTFELRFDDVLDLAQAIEMIMLKLTGKLLRPQFRPEVKNRAALCFTRMLGGDYSLASGEAPLPATTVCDVTGHDVKTHYLLIEIHGNRWEQWFGRLDELVKCLYVVIREAQGDPYEARPMVMVGANGPVAAVTPDTVTAPGGSVDLGRG
jgi:hypothetical protein